MSKKYYSYNGKQTNLGKKESIKFETTEMNLFKEVRKLVDDLPLTTQDYNTLTEVIDRRINDYMVKIEKLQTV